MCGLSDSVAVLTLRLTVFIFSGAVGARQSYSQREVFSLSLDICLLSNDSNSNENEEADDEPLSPVLRCVVHPVLLVDSIGTAGQWMFGRILQCFFYFILSQSVREHHQSSTFFMDAENFSPCSDFSFTL